jgi:hypothetical protein
MDHRSAILSGLLKKVMPFLELHLSINKTIALRVVIQYFMLLKTH